MRRPKWLTLEQLSFMQCALHRTVCRSKNADKVKHAVDGRNPAPPNDGAPVNTNKQWFQPWFQSGANGFRNHPQYALLHMYKRLFLDPCEEW